uniref:Uncharacterized protein n=1 Tax=Anguilla anguilla TaxID=7936 RepID=A0A0E9XFM8_ANGAN
MDISGDFFPPGGTSCCLWGLDVYYQSRCK